MARLEGRDSSGETDAPRGLRQRFLAIDPLVRFMIVHWVLGAATGLFCAALLLALDPFGLRPLIFRGGLAVPALTLLGLGFASTFGGLACAAAVMYPDGFGYGGGRPPRCGLKAPVAARPAYARAPRRG